VTGLMIHSGMVKPKELLTLNEGVVEVTRMMTILLTFLVELLVFYFYALNLLRTHKELRILANTDELTNIANRRVLFERGEEMFNLSHKYQKSFMLMILDIDHFKSINDQYGHPAGDKVLKELTQLISEKIRTEDLICRYGGEEFAIIFRNVSEEELSIVKGIRERIANHHFYVTEDTYVTITFSAGAVLFQEEANSFGDLVMSADKLLYKAKVAGRNRVFFGSGQEII
jgi:diguanylate cyclase (GGDEF)-like protein